ncbi:MAG: TonB family protein [Elusimicrobia bacterium]|nr:TonB family protein [Elusimicrobiota bacterium]
MTAIRLPVSVASSIVLHGGLLFLYLQAVPTAKKEPLRVISDVDLLVQVRKAAVAPVPKPAGTAPPTTWNFLKMALPAIERAAAPKAVEIKLPERAKTLTLEPEKIQDKGRRQAEAKLEPLELGRRRVEAARLEAPPEPERRRAAALAEAPRLEEVGRRRVRDLPQALELEDRRREAVTQQRLDAIAPPVPGRRAPAAVLSATVLREASPPERARLGDKMEALLPEPVRGSGEPLPQVGPDPAALRKKIDMGSPAAKRRPQADAIVEEGKKGVEIEGPLKDRRILYTEMPEFPAWLREMSVDEAAVAIRFWVSPDGTVLPDMRVERTSGYGRLDRLAMECLKKWRFAPIGSQEKQWGIITFRFVTE